MNHRLNRVLQSYEKKYDDGTWSYLTDNYLIHWAYRFENLLHLYQQSVELTQCKYPQFRDHSCKHEPQD